MLYVLKARTILPKLNYVYRDGDYLNYLRKHLSRDDFIKIDNDIKQLRQTHIKFYRRIYTTDTCITEYIFETSENRSDVLKVLQKNFDDKIDISYTSSEENMSIKDYIFLQ